MPLQIAPRPWTRRRGDHKAQQLDLRVLNTVQGVVLGAAGGAGLWAVLAGILSMLIE